MKKYPWGLIFIIFAHGRWPVVKIWVWKVPCARYLVARYLVARYLVARYLVARYLATTYLVTRYLDLRRAPLSIW